MGNRLFSELLKLEGAVDWDKDPFDQGIRWSMPSMNFIFGNTHLLPFGYTAILWGPPKGGKSVLCNDAIGQLHRDDPDAIAVKYNTEKREKIQMNRRIAAMYGIDLNRYVAFEVNTPEGVFDAIEKDIAKKCEQGLKIKLIEIDSVTDILGRRFLNADTVSTQQIGDAAATMQDGLKRIKDVARNYEISLILTAQERSELDQLEQMRGKKVKMAGAYYLRHFGEYFIYVAPNQSAPGKMDLLENKFEHPYLKDMEGKPEMLAHKIKVQMKDSTVGVKGRIGEFTFSYNKGVINTHEEAFLLGLNRRVLKHPNNKTYVLPDWPEKGKNTEWVGKEATLVGLRDNEMVRREIVNRIKMTDIDAFKNGVVVEEPSEDISEESEESE